MFKSKEKKPVETPEPAKPQPMFSASSTKNYETGETTVIFSIYSSDRHGLSYGVCLLDRYYPCAKLIFPADKCCSEVEAAIKMKLSQLNAALEGATHV